MRNQNASVLVGLLWCLALVSVIVIGVLHSGQMDLQVVKNQGDRIQAHYLALAGVEKAKALLYQDAITRKRASQNHSGDLYNSPTPFRDIRLGRGSFRVFHQGDPEKGEKVQFGIVAARPAHVGVRERFAHAEALVALGRDEAALPWFESIAGAYDLPFLAIAQLRQGQIHERAGRRARSAECYRRALKLWRAADKGLAPLVDQARAGLARVQ